MARPKKRTRKALFDAPAWRDELAIHGIRLGYALIAHITVFFERFGLTPLQYNVLRILYVRDPELEGLPTGTIGAALMARGTDVTRIVDRLEKLGLIERIREATDRRVVRVRLTTAGFDLVEEIHDPLLELNQQLFAHVSDKDAERIARDLRHLADTLPRVTKSGE